MDFLQSGMTDGTHLSTLVAGKADALADEFNVRYTTATDDVPDCVAHLDQADVFKFCALLATCVGVLAAEFDRRISFRVKSWLMKLLMFVLKPHSIMCASRKAAALELSGCGWATLDSTAAKFKYIFAADIAFAAGTSLCSLRFYTMLVAWRDQCWSDIQCVESGQRHYQHH